MWMNKKQKLKASYYNSFFALIVIPILCISLLAIFILRAQMVDSAVLNIRRAQDTARQRARYWQTLRRRRHLTL